MALCCFFSGAKGTGRQYWLSIADVKMLAATMYYSDKVKVITIILFHESKLISPTTREQGGRSKRMYSLLMKGRHALVEIRLLQNDVWSSVSLKNLLAFLFTRHEFGYDRFHDDADRIYRVKTSVVFEELSVFETIRLKRICSSPASPSWKSSRSR